MNTLIDDLERRLNGVCGSLNVVHSQLVDLTVEALASNTWEQFGIRSPEHWVTWKTGLSPYRARDIVRLARRKAELPYIFDAFGNGLLAIDQVIVLARHARPCHDQELAELAPFMTVAQLTIVLSRYRHHDDLDEPEPAAAYGSNRSAEPDDDDDDDITVAYKFSDGDTDEPIDLNWLYGDTSARDATGGNTTCGGSDCHTMGGDSKSDNMDVDIDAALADWLANPSIVADETRPTEPGNTSDINGSCGFDSKFDATSATKPTVGDDGGPPWQPQRDSKVIESGEHLFYGWTADGKFRLTFTGNADTGALIMQALDEIRDRLFRDSGRTSTGGDVMREACGRMLANTSPDRADRFRAYVHLDTDGAWLSQGPRIPEWLRRKLTCDGHLKPVWETDGTPVNLGRTVRTFPDHIRRLILDRDRTCRRPGCSNTKGLEAHHVQHWEDGGESSPQNGTGLCPSDHDAHHRGEFSITGNADLPNGLTFRDRWGRIIPNGPQPVPPTEPPRTASYAHPLGETFNPHWFTLSEAPAHRRSTHHPDFDLTNLSA
jgi:hypothetical protein